MYDDPNPPAWPNNGIPFNRWYSDLPQFLERLRRFRWYKDGHRFKYVSLRIDTRNGNFVLFDRAGKPASPDELFPPGAANASAEDVEALRMGGDR